MPVSAATLPARACLEIEHKKPPRALDHHERRQLARATKRSFPFKEAVNRVLMTPVVPGWQDKLRERAASGKMLMVDWFAWSLAYAAGGDSDILGEPMCDRPPDNRAARLLAELSRELAPEASREGGLVFNFIFPTEKNRLPLSAAITTPALPPAKADG